MKVIAILAHKGGVGKTTLAINLAVAAQEAGLSAAIIDLDPQASARFWSQRRADSNALALLVVDSAINGLNVPLAALAELKTDIVFLDLATSIEQGSDVVCALADFILIPAQPSPVDLHAVARTMAIADDAKKPASAILNLCPHYGSATSDAANAILSKFRFPLAEQTLGRRVAHQKAYLQGQGVCETEPRSKAAFEVRAVLSWLLEELSLSKPRKRRRNV